jgi:hypothetical protein
MRSVYIIGGPGAGKSTFMARLLIEMGVDTEPLEDLHAKRNVKNLVTLRGHRLSDGGVYLGKMREQFPGTDGLDRVSSPVAVEWLETGPDVSYILAEGATLATQGFLGALSAHTDLLLLHLVVDDETRAKRFAERGSTQSATWVKASVGRAAAAASRYPSLTIDAADADAWELGLDLVKTFLGKH